MFKNHTMKKPSSQLLLTRFAAIYFQRHSLEPNSQRLFNKKLVIIIQFKKTSFVPLNTDSNLSLGKENMLEEKPGKTYHRGGMEGSSSVL